MDGGGSLTKANSFMVNIRRVTPKPQKHTQDWMSICYWFCLGFWLFTNTGHFLPTNDVWFWSITHYINPSWIYVSIFTHTDGGRHFQVISCRSLCCCLVGYASLTKGVMKWVCILVGLSGALPHTQVLLCKIYLDYCILRCLKAVSWCFGQRTDYQTFPVFISILFWHIVLF